MLKKDFFFKNHKINSIKFNENLKKTKKAFLNLKFDIKNHKIPFLQSFKKDYFLDFSTLTVKKFSKYKNIVIIGMGGSVLGAKSIYNFFKERIKKEVFFFDNLDENLYLEFKKIKNSCFIIISKSGETIESITNLNILLSNFSLKNKLVFITEINKNNSMVNIANKLNAEIIEHKNFIGGRYSVLSEVGMFPAAIMGLNIKKFKMLEKLINDKNFTLSLIQNVAYIFTLNSNGIKNSIILNYDSDLKDLSYWYQQLVSESLGKKGKGITTIITEAPKDHHSVMQLYLDGPKDKFFTFFNSENKKSNLRVSKNIASNKIQFLKNKKIRSIINAQSKAVKNTFRIKKIPFRQISFNKKNEEELGKIFTFFVLETLLLAKLMKVNPLDQPAVEKIKFETKKILT
jgi:glucose-6-phosphate isomerase